jgi:hypothetical protein
LVIRALSSSFRRSPGEVFFSKCGGGSGGRMDEDKSNKIIEGVSPFEFFSGTKKIGL